MKRIQVFHIDAFTEPRGQSSNRPFTGNPAAVCLLEEPADPAWMQSIANEINLSETAFIHREKEGFGLRWFTPRVEVPLCGHATLAGAHVLWETEILAGDSPAHFFTLSGELVARRREKWIELNFPAKPVHAVAARPGLIEALGVTSQFIGSDGDNDLVLLASETEVMNAAPDFAARQAACPFGVILTAPSADPAYDFVSRYFAPCLGINEDPVTGSSHCALGPFWQARLKRDALLARQVSERGGVVRVEVLDGRVLLGGQAVTIFRGELL